MIPHMSDLVDPSDKISPDCSVKDVTCDLSKIIQMGKAKQQTMLIT